VVDAVSAIRKLDGKIKVQHEVKLLEFSSNQATLLNFVLWLSWQEATAGEAFKPRGDLRDYIGVDDKFVKEVTRIMESNHLVLLLLAAKFPESKVVARLRDCKITLLKRSLSEKDTAILEETFGLASAS
jgi:uncharacterized membrane protein